jgi:hypothetical protein
VKSLVLAATAALSLAFAGPAVAATEQIPVQATKASVDSWVGQASAHDMRVSTRYNLDEGVERDCGISAAGSSDCAVLDRNPGSGNPYQEIQVGSQRWRRDIPGGPWQRLMDVASENPIANVSRYWSYNPFEPWNAKKGVTWKMKTKTNGDVVITSTIVNPGDDEPKRTRVAISPNGLHFSITAKAENGSRLWRTTGELVDGVVVTAPTS